MGKRSDFKRIDKDFYRTIDRRAVQALAPHLEPQTRFIEPCAGAGDLVDWLEAEGHICDLAADISPQHFSVVQGDARTWFFPKWSDCIITNPPWSRPILHTLIKNLSRQYPTWLLFDSNWANTKQAAPYLQYCRKIVAVGRLIWIPETKMSGKDDVSWFLFDQNSQGQTEFYGRPLCTAQ